MNYANEPSEGQAISPIDEAVKRNHNLSDQIHVRLDWLTGRLSLVLAPQLPNTSSSNEASTDKLTAALAASPLQAELESHGNALIDAIGRIDNLINRLAV